MTTLRYLAVLLFLALAHSMSVRQSEDAKVALEQYILEKRPHIATKWRPLYHVTPPVGWMNDPNGFSFYKGEFHLFYQFYPYDSIWGPMHWGHVSSKDLVTWVELPTALLPDEEMCFSGSAVVEGDTLMAIYTGHVLTDDDPYFNQTQYLAYSNDGINFDKYEGNPILTYAPNNVEDFRDPKVWKYDDYWYMVLGSKTTDNRGHALLYKSEDLKRWEYVNVLGESNGDLGYMWECPDFFELGGKHILMISPEGMIPEGDRYKNYDQTGYIIGSFNYDTYEFVPEVGFQEIDMGHDFYAAQTTDHDGKRYIVGWFNMWDMVPQESIDGWAGTMTLIRELSLVGNTIIQKPLEAQKTLRQDNAIIGDYDPSQTLEFGKAAEVIVEGSLDEKIELLLEGSEGGAKTWVRWEPDTGKVVVDRGSGDIRQMTWTPIGPKSLRLFLDASTLEVFCGEGEVVFSSRVFPLGDWRVTNQSPQTLSVEAYSLNRGVPE